MKQKTLQFACLALLAGVAMAGKITSGGGAGVDTEARATADAALVRSNFTTLCVSDVCISDWSQVAAASGSNGVSWMTEPTGTNTFGVPGALAYGSNALYICVASNLWRRATLGGW